MPHKSPHSQTDTVTHIKECPELISIDVLMYQISVHSICLYNISQAEMALSLKEISCHPHRVKREEA